MEVKKLMAKCIVRRYANELDEEEAIIECNRQRIKTLVQLYKENDILKAILAKKAEERKKQNLKQFPDVRYSGLSEGIENEMGRTRDKLIKISV
jgi:hypothetical protein